MDSAQRGLIMVALAFPLYLLWKGELPAYLKLMVFSGAVGNALGALGGPVGPAVSSGILGGGALPYALPGTPAPQA